MKKEAKNFPSLTTNRIPVKNARSGLASVLNYHQGSLNRQPVVLMPSYIGWSPNEGSGLMDPVLNSGFTPIFYQINDLLQPDFDELCKVIVANPTSALLIVHYFGMRVDIPKQVSEIAKNSEVTIIEDWAHDLSQIENEVTNSPNHFKIYSLHKWTASKSGGFITGCFPELEKLITQPMDPADADVYMRSNLLKIAEVRWTNFLHAERLLAKVQRIDFFYTDSKQFTCPLNLPMMAKSLNERHGLYTKLVDNGIIPTALYHILVPQLDKQEFERSVNISNRIINLPIHQDCTSDEIDVMAEVIKEWEKHSVGLE
jgi:dTDP-4-amino-4,6-dideoxygalactose transaminase